MWATVSRAKTAPKRAVSGGHRLARHMARGGDSVKRGGKRAFGVASRRAATNARQW